VITFNSHRAEENHLQIGYRGKRTSVIPNGFELDRFRFSHSERNSIRNELGLTEEKVIITVGRWDIQKDYYTLMAALNILQKKYHGFKMVMVGQNLDSENMELVDLINKYDLESKVLLLGRRNDVPALLSAADIYVSSSLGESFSNSIGEAMACELPCVVTNVGDSKLIVGETGVVVQAQDCEALAAGLLNGVSKKGGERCSSARKRVVSNYDITSVAQKFQEVWGSLEE
jgi:glycosyltransferase involved in cell wall biosynthesis